MSKVVGEIEREWLARFSEDKLEQSLQAQKSIVQWLLGEEQERWETFNPQQREIENRGLKYRYQILKQRYLNVTPNQAYRNLLHRLSSIASLRQKIKTWVSLSRDRQRAVVDVIKEVIQEMLNKDSYLKGQMTWIAQCTPNVRMRDSLLFASIEEYCLRSIPMQNQPLIVCRFVNYLRTQSRNGITQLPQNEKIRILSEQVILDEQENSISLLDHQAVSLYQDIEYWNEVEATRYKVQKSFEIYLAERLGDEAVQWLRLYLAGQSQEAIAKSLNLPIERLYRLRETISYHAIQVFALKEESHLIFDWLEISPQQHSLGLTPKKWEIFLEKISPKQKQILDLLQEGLTLEEVAQSLEVKRAQVVKEWSKAYLIAQKLRRSP